MILLLSIETSTHSFSCALHQDGKLIAFKESASPQTTASMLAVMIDRLFSEAHVKKNLLSGVIVASGPGSYTGLRIGVATAKGICYALNVPLVSVNTLYLMAHQVENSINIKNAILCPMLDARRMEVYCSLFDENLNEIEATHAKIIDESSFIEVLNQKPVIFFGEGSDKSRQVIKHTNARFVENVIPMASALGEIGFQKFASGDFEDIEHFEPLYLKDFIIKKPKSVF